MASVSRIIRRSAFPAPIPLLPEGPRASGTDVRGILHGRRRALSGLLLFLLLHGTAAAQSPEWKHERGFRDALLHLHPVINYGFDPAWQRQWQEGLFAANGVRGSFGSVTLTRLLCDWRTVINQRLVGGLWFRLDDLWYGGRHLDDERTATFVGLEQYLWRGVSVFCYGDLAHRKEDADILAGISLTDSLRHRYTRVAFLDEDQFYDEKSPRRGVTLQRPLGVAWALQQTLGRLTVFSEGRRTSGFRRSYDDREFSPDISGHDRRMDDALAAVYCDIAEGSYLELLGSVYEFEESKRYHEGANDYEYANRIAWLRLSLIRPLGGGGRLRLGAAGVSQRASSQGSRVFTYRRRELLPHAFVELSRSFGILELGYMGSVYRWDYEAEAREENYDDSGYVDKVKLGYSYVFSPRSRIQLSLSHVVAIEEFGGGNAQLIMFF